MVNPQPGDIIKYTRGVQEFILELIDPSTFEHKWTFKPVDPIDHAFYGVHHYDGFHISTFALDDQCCTLVSHKQQKKLTRLQRIAKNLCMTNQR